MWLVYRTLEGEWVLVGQYRNERQARLIADDYYRRGIESYVQYEG